MMEIKQTPAGRPVVWAVVCGEHACTPVLAFARRVGDRLGVAVSQAGNNDRCGISCAMSGGHTRDFWRKTSWVNGYEIGKREDDNTIEQPKLNAFVESVIAALLQDIDSAVERAKE